MYLRGIEQLRISNAEALLEADLLLNQAIEQDSEFTEARLALARTVMQQMGQGVVSHEEGMSQAEQLVGEVLASQPENLAARQFLATLNFTHVTWDQMDMTSIDADLDEMLLLFEEGVGLPYARRTAANMLAMVGRFEEARRLVDQALATDPLNYELLSAQSNVLQQLGFYEEAQVSLLKQQEIEPENAMVQYRLGLLEQQRDHYVDALPYMKQHALLDRTSPHPTLFLGHLFNDAGLYSEADRWYERFEARNPDAALLVQRDVFRARARGDRNTLKAVLDDSLERSLNGEVPPEMLGPIARFYAHLAVEDGRSQEALDYIESYYPGISDFKRFAGSNWLVYRLQYYGVLPLALAVSDDDARILQDAVENAEKYGIQLEDFPEWNMEFQYLVNGLDAGKAAFMELYSDNLNVFDFSWQAHVEAPWLAGLRQDPEVAAVIAARETRIAEIREELRAVIEQPEWRDDTL